MARTKVISLLFALLPFIAVAQNTNAPGIHEFVYVDTEPVILNLPNVRKEIGYPFEALKRGIEGKVYCRILVDENGNYTRHQITGTTHPLFSEAVERHIGELRFLPAIRNHQPLCYWTNIPIAFVKAESKKYIQGESAFYSSSLNPKNRANARRRFLQAEENRAKNKYEAAILNYTRSLMYIPQARKKPRKVANTLFQIYKGRGIAYLESRNYSAALADFTQAIGLAQTSSKREEAALLAETYNLRAYCYLATGQAAKANEDAQWVIFHFPKQIQQNIRAYAHKAAALRQLGMYEEALAVVQSAIEMDKNAPYAYFHKGLIFWSIGAEEAAIQSFESAVSMGLPIQEQHIVDQLLNSGDFASEEP